jgi:cysteine desulfurase / selenocysteine lyase
MAVFNPEKLRLDFPILQKEKEFGRLVYLDNGATTQKPKIVIDAISHFYENHNSNVHRCIHELGESATTFYENARRDTAKFINAVTEEIVFTKGTTESINFIADTWGLSNVNSGDAVVTTQIEHHANYLPWLRLTKRKGAEFKLIKFNKNSFTFETDNLEEIITSKTKIVALTHSSNVLGEVWQKGQLKKVIKRAHEVGAKVLLDAAQSVAHRKIDVKSLDADFFVFSGHKMMAPTGVGVLYIKKELHKDVEPYQVGGSMAFSVSQRDVKYKDTPYKFEAGTPPIAQVIGLGKAIEYINENIDFDELKKHEASLCNALLSDLIKIKGVVIWGNVDSLQNEGHLVSLSVDGVHVHDLSAYLSRKGVSVRSGHHCAQPLASLLGVEASLRVSFYAYNTMDDVQAFVKNLREAIAYFRPSMGFNSACL